MNAYTVIDDRPSRRFPVYTRGNSGEVFPNVMTPLTGTLIGDASTDGQRRAMLSLGLVVPGDIDGEESFGTGVFGGYLYGNLSLLRVASARAPGLRAEDADRQVAGLSDDAPRHRSQPGDGSLRATLRSSWTMGNRLLRPVIDEVDDARRATDEWTAAVPDPATRSDEELVTFALAYPPRFADGMCRLLTCSGFAAAGAAVLEQLADRARAPAGTVIALTAGLGTIDSASPAFRLWALGRAAATSSTLTRCFDEGADLDRLRGWSGEADVAAFLVELDAFLAAHGARGPDEWELASPTWGTDPQIALVAIERLRQAPEERDPVAAGRRLADDRARATAEVRRALPGPLRPLFDRVVHAARLYAAGRERAKALFIDDVYPLRRALFELADRARRRGGPEARRDAFLVTADELRDFVADPSAFVTVIEERRATRDFLQARVPPFVFEGEIPDPSTWPLRAAPRAAGDGQLQGQGVCPGVARGPARIVTDPADPGQLQPGDILVAPITDPAWTPLFLAAAGVIVDVGAQQSHAAIVARELGIPAVVGVAGATARLRDGQLVEVDGSTGTVTVLEPGAPRPATPGIMAEESSR